MGGRPFIENAGNSKIEKLRSALLCHQNIARLEIAMYHFLLMSIVHGRAYLLK